MTSIQHVVGSAAQPQGDGRKIIAHVCNNAGVWGRGFARTLDRFWPQARVAYKAWYKELGYRLALGTTHVIELEDSDVLIANMIARRGVRLLPIQPAAINHAALEKCLTTVANRARYFEASVHLPRLRQWRKVAPIVEQTLVAAGVPVFVYTNHR
jgi:O-acetyl-ADP-ribose deacetylase (regulator of RNase III)